MTAPSTLTKSLMYLLLLLPQTIVADLGRFSSATVLSELSDLQEGQIVAILQQASDNHSVKQTIMNKKEVLRSLILRWDDHKKSPPLSFWQRVSAFFTKPPATNKENKYYLIHMIVPIFSSHDMDVDSLKQVIGNIDERYDRKNKFRNLQTQNLIAEVAMRIGLDNLSPAASEAIKWALIPFKGMAKDNGSINRLRKFFGLNQYR